MRNTALASLRNRRLLVLASIDSAAWLVAMFLAAAARLAHWGVEPTVHQTNAGSAVPLYGVLIVASIAVTSHLVLAAVTRLHLGRAKLGSFEEAFLVASVVAGAGLIAFGVNAAVDPFFLPRTTPLVAACFATLLCFWPRGLYRILVQEARLRRAGDHGTPVLLAGAGDAGRQLVESMLRDQSHRWIPVGFVDDDPRKTHFRFRGVRVLGKIKDLGRVARRKGASTVVLSIPSASSELVVRVRDLARNANLDLKVLPPVAELLTAVGHMQIRDLQPTDLLGRHQIETDVAEIASYLSGRRVLVTGAGGSIGSELCRQISNFNPAELVMLDRDESALHSLVLSLDGRADLESPNVVLADIRDMARMQEVFDHHRPDVVFHAAALKHVNVLEQHPSEAWKTNVVGTRNVLEAAAASGVGRFVNISTDKAADPENALGYSKRLAEGLTAHQAGQSAGTYLSVRFGNVLGTRGSVLTTFESQIKSGQPVTVTHPEVTRYFMTVNEAVQLVIQAAAIGFDGEALVLDMGKPVRIMEVAEKLIEHFGAAVPIIVTGLKPGEKLHETLLGVNEREERTVHPLVSHVDVPPLDPRGWPNDDVPGDVLLYMQSACEAMDRALSTSAGDEVTATGRDRL
jgi:FlaA1/EpsC-like NDP-sugar epimerase